jgi:hypothetical protein
MIVRNNMDATVESEMRIAIRVWLDCPAEKRPSPDALGARIRDIAAASQRRHEK